MAHVELAEGSVNAMAAPLSHPDQAQLSAKHFQATFALLASFTLLPSLRRFICLQTDNRLTERNAVVHRNGG